MEPPGPISHGVSLRGKFLYIYKGHRKLYDLYTSFTLQTSSSLTSMGAESHRLELRNRLANGRTTGYCD